MLSYFTKLTSSIMGSAVSKSETKVYTPKAPVDYSASFLSHLENSQESDYTRAQFAENFIQERVAAELKKLETEAVDNFKKTTSDALLTDDDSTVSVSKSSEKIEALNKQLHENAKLASVELGEGVTQARNSVIACLKENKGKSLNCWEEVEQFKKMVHGM